MIDAVVNPEEGLERRVEKLVPLDLVLISEREPKVAPNWSEFRQEKTSSCRDTSEVSLGRRLPSDALTQRELWDHRKKAEAEREIQITDARNLTPRQPAAGPKAHPDNSL